MRLAINILLWIILSLFFLVMGLLVFTQTAWFRSIVKNQAESIINENVKGNITIGSVHGNFFTTLELHEINATLPDGEPLLSLKTLSLKYSPWHLLNNVIKVDNILLDEPVIFIHQENDSVWNFHHFLPDRKHPKDDSDSTKTFPFSIVLNNFNLSDGNIHLSMPDTIIPKQLENLNIHLNGTYKNGNLISNLKNLSFKAREPNLELKSLTVLFESDFQKYTIRNFYLETALNAFDLNADYENINDFEADLNWPSVNTEEFSFVLPDITIPANPDLTFKTKLYNDTLKLQLDLKHNNEEIQIDGYAYNFSSLLDSTLRHTVLIDFNLIIRNLQPEHWIGTIDLPLLLNTHLDITGNGLADNSVPLRISGNLDGTRWEDYLLKTGKIDLSYLNGATNAQIEIGGDFGELKTIAELNTNNLKGPFRANVQTYQLAIHQILPDVMDSTWLTLNLEAEGEGIGTDNLAARFNGAILNTVVEKIPIDTLNFTGFLANEVVTLDTLSIKNASIDLALKGKYAFDGNLSADIAGDIYNTDAFSAYFSQPVEWEKMSLKVSAHGHTDTLSVDLSGQTQQLKLDTTLSVNNLNFEASGLLTHMVPDVEFSLLATEIIASDNNIDSLSVTASMQDQNWEALVSAALPEEMNLVLNASGNLGDTMNIELHQLDFNSPFADIALMSPPSIITYSDSIIHLKNFNLFDKNDEDFQLQTEAMYQHGDSLRLNSAIKNFNLEMLSWFGISQTYIKGFANLDINIVGNRNGFTINGHTSLNDLEMEPFAISNIIAEISYPGDTAKIGATIYNHEGDSITIKAETPLVMDLRDSIHVFWPQTFKAALTANQTRLSGFFLTMPGMDQPKALMTINLNADGHVNNPHIKGYLDIVDGEVPLPKHGINYNDVRLKLSIDGSEIQLDSLFARHGNGSLLARGKIVMDSILFSGQITSTDLTLRAREFYITRHRDYEAQINADAFFRDVDDNPRFGGNIRVLRSSFNLPAIMRLADEGAQVNDPLLVQALRDERHIVTEEIDTLQIRETRESQSDLFKQLTGSIKLNIPRNTWIRSPDMQMELYGDLDIVKNSEAFELFGNLGIHRGFYTLYGKKLNIREGEFNFTGGDAFDPLINLRAEYVFRSSDRIRRELTLLVSGRSTDPDIQFELDSQNIPEQDAMAYLLFGQPFDELSFGNQEGVSNAVPSRLLTGLVSSQLSKTIGSALNLDMIEIDAGDNWQNTTFMVGKYITNNLFVTYQRSFGEAKSDAISPETITLEYEISRRLSLRLMQGDVKDSGVDIILKFER